MSRPIYRTPNDLWSRVDVRGADECWPWLGNRNHQGYGQMIRGAHHQQTHRIALELSLGQPIPDGMLAIHSCDNPPCCNPAHLRVGTAQDNMRDMVERRRGRWDRDPDGSRRLRQSLAVRGEQARRAKLTDAEVMQLRQDAANGLSYLQIAAKFEVSYSLISKIVRGINWSHLPVIPMAVVLGQSKKRSCPKGHPYDAENTRWYRGERNCRACDRERTIRRRARDADRDVA